ncbi:MAG: sigma-70 family RNA polymerase sigma factor [Planctomycetota bacterium]|nr:MAG: sigma-70 family RNA polymerase sigma factor [Planctomycetota bacterium]
MMQPHPRRISDAGPTPTEAEARSAADRPCPATLPELRPAPDRTDDEAHADESRARRLIRAAVDGDGDALEALLEQFGPVAAHRIAAEIGAQWRSALDVDDIMQVTYLEAFLEVRTFEGGTSRSFAAWLMRIARNNLRDAIRGLEAAKRPHSHQRVKLPSSDDSYAALAELVTSSGATPSRCVARDEARARLEAALDRLPADYANVLRMHDLQGRRMAEIARRMHRSRGGLYAMRARALQRLRDLLGSGSKYFSSG